MPRRATTEVEALRRKINEKFPGALMVASDPSLEITRLSTGILSLDCALGGGFPRGRHVEIYGGFNVGKTYTTFKFIATCQAAGLRCAFFDVEGTFDPAFAEHAGVDLEELEFPLRGQNANRLVSIMESLLYSELYDVIVLDSIAALLPRQEQETTMEEGSFGTQQAKLMSAALRRLTTANKRTVLVYINQTRENIGVMFGKKTVTSGGRAMAFYAGIRLEMVRTETVKRKAKLVDHKSNKGKTGDIVKGHRVLVRVEKDKTGGARPLSETTFVFDYDLGGIDPVEDLMYLGRMYDLIAMSGNTWTLVDYEDEAQPSRVKFKKWLRRNVAVQEELTELVRQHAQAAMVGSGEEAEQPDE